MITTIIFDWGGVLTIGKYTPQILHVLESDLKRSFDDHYPLFDKEMVHMNAGDIDHEEFIRRVNKLCKISLSLNEWTEIFRRSIKPRNEVIALAEQLSLRYRLIMLSDNDAMTVANLEAGHAGMLGLFEKKYFSHDLNMRKPDPRFFQHVIDDAKLIPKECVFIDDKKKNADAAAESGMHGIVFTDLHTLKMDLSSLGVTGLAR